jgi:glycosyltransferase involved in cell wall biosynthesis
LLLLPHTLARFCDHIKAYAPDILHTHLLAAGFIGAFAMARTAPPVLIHTRHYADFFHGLRGFVARRVDHWVMRNSPRLIAISPTVERLLREQIAIRPSAIWQINNGVEVADRQPMVDAGENPLRAWEPQRRPRIGAVGNFSWIKGMDVLVNAAPAILKDFPEAVFFLIGEGKGKAALEKAVRARGLSAAVRFTGFVDQLPAALSGLDLLVVPSRSEGFGLVACEAFAADTPVVASDAEGLTGVIEAEKSGLLFECGDADDLARQVIRLLEDDALRAAIVKKARTMVEERYDIRQMVHAYEDLYQHSLGEPGS